MYRNNRSGSDIKNSQNDKLDTLIDIINKSLKLIYIPHTSVVPN